MDKATLLAEVVQQVKELKNNAAEAGKGLLLPTEVDEVRVVPHDDGTGDGTFSYFTASVCCDYSPRLLSDIRQALDTLNITIVKAEICSLGGRMKSVFVFTSCNKQKSNNSETHRLLASSVHQTLSTVLDTAAVTPEFSPRTPNPNKRRRVSFFDSSSSSS